MKLWPTIEAVNKNGRYYLKEKNMKKKYIESDPIPVNKKDKFKKKHRYRSSITGLFVSEKYAKKHPKTTEKELIK